MAVPLCDRRVERGMTQSELALAVGLSQGEISRIETGRRRLTVDLLLAIARAIDVKPAALLQGKSKAA